MKKDFEVRVNQGAPINRLGRTSVPFRINLSPEGFDRFLNVVPLAQREYFVDRADRMGEPAVEVTLPEVYMDSFDLSDPRLTVLEMYSHAMHNRMFAAADVLLNVTKVVA